ncbi:MAG: amidohydrolase [Myxococcales bacterium]
MNLLESALAALAAVAGAVAAASAGPAPVVARTKALYPEVEALYLDLHRTPELSGHEEQTAAKMAARLRALGFEVTERVGGFGVVGVLRNGEGPRVLVRTDMDALPVEEKTGLAYASRATAKDEEGKAVPVAHACGHDVHMSAWVGAATLLARVRDAWKGTLVFVGQPSEEKGNGAQAMLDAGLYARFGKPDHAIAIHDTPELPSGIVAWTSGFALANVDSVDVTIFGRGGHGAYPHRTVDPIVIGARFVTALQTVVARENDPFDPAVVTVGSFHAGTKHNIIPDDARLQLTVRSYKDEVRKKLLDAIRRIARAEAAAGGAPREPEVKVSEGTAATYNDPALTKRLADALRAQLGAERVQEKAPVMGGEDFSAYGRAGVPATLLWIGAAEPKAFAAAKAKGEALPSLHSSQFAPDRQPTLETAVATLTISVLELLGNRR